MKTSFRILTAAAAAAMMLIAPSATAKRTADTGNFGVSELKMNKIGGNFQISMQLALDSLKVGANRQLYVSPVVEGQGGASAVFPAVLINGRNMHFAYERGLLRKEKTTQRYDLYCEVRRANGTPQTVDYVASVPFEPWMYGTDTRVRLLTDTCGCGMPIGTGVGPEFDPQLNPLPRLRSVFVTPAVTPLPVQIHEGKARVQFEVDRTVLHDSVYRCKSGQKIDNRAQLKVIYDSIAYALSDPNAEIAQIDVCGYASPESPYLHNEELATGRSRALAEFIADRFKLPREVCTYSSVPENWGEFREMVVASPELTDQQRADLLELIDRPTYGPSDFDAKEKELKTSPKFAELYRKTILPVWFPKLRATKFAISTRLKPMSDEELAGVLATSPEKMSLNQIFRVARLYPEGSPEFNAVIRKALDRYPASEEANLNAAVALIREGDYASAKPQLAKAGHTPEAENARGIIAASEGDFSRALTLFRSALPLPEAQRNLDLLEEK